MLGVVSVKTAGRRTTAHDRTLDVDKVPALAARAVALFIAAGADKARVEQARTYLRKLQGKRAAPKAVDDPNTPDVDESEKSISASQQSDAAMLANFLLLIDYLNAQPEYNKLTEPELKIADLQAFHTATQTKHDASISAAAEETDAKSDRDKRFYTDADSAYMRITGIKNYVKSVYGANSPEYKTIKGIAFRKR